MFMIREILGYCIISAIGLVCMTVLYSPNCFVGGTRFLNRKQIGEYRIAIPTSPMALMMQ